MPLKTATLGTLEIKYYIVSFHVSGRSLNAFAIGLDSNRRPDMLDPRLITFSTTVVCKMALTFHRTFLISFLLCLIEGQ